MHDPIPRQIKDLRRAAGVTQKQLARHAGVGLRFIRDVEQGRRVNASVGKLNDVLGFFDRHLLAVPSTPAAVASTGVHEPRARYRAARKKIIIIAGPNGAGKTTFAQEFLPREADCTTFVNADLIASGLAPFAPDRAALKAGRIMLAEIQAQSNAGQSFAFETTLSGRRYANAIMNWRQNDYGVKLVFLQVKDVETAIQRVAVRVTHGGHSIPEATIRRRHRIGWENFNEIYKRIVDTWVLYDNSGTCPVLLDEGEDI